MRIEKGVKQVPDEAYVCDRCKTELPKGYAEQPIQLEWRKSCPYDDCYSDEENRHYCGLKCFSEDAGELISKIEKEDWALQTLYITVHGEGLSLVSELAEMMSKMIDTHQEQEVKGELKEEER